MSPPDSAIGELLEVAAETSEVSAAALAAGLGAYLPAAADRRGVSTLNNDGSPLQIVLSASAAGVGTRLLVDPGLEEATARGRLARAREALSRSCRGWPPGRRAELEAAVTDGLPVAAALDALRSGALWVGCGATGPEVLAYLSGRWGPASGRWARAEGWFGRWGGAEPAAACRRLAPRCELASLAVAGDGRRASLKCYFRLQRPQQLGTLELPGLEEPQVARFLRVVLGERGLAPAGLVLSFSTPLGGGPVDGSKVDLCAHCLGRGPGEWVEVLRVLADDLDVPLPVDPRALLDRRAEVAFVGLGVGRRTRLNVYLKPVADRPVASGAVDG